MLKSDIKPEFFWDLTKFYKSEQDWFSDLKIAKTYVNKIKEFKNKLASKSSLLAFYELDKECGTLLGRLSMYCHNHLNTDISNGKFIEMQNLLSDLGVALSEGSSFYAPEMLSFSEDYFKDLLNDKNFELHKLHLTKLLKQKKHVLTEQEETLLAKTGAFAGEFESVFSSLMDVDLKFENALDSVGGKHEVTNSTVSSLLKSPDRVLRKNAYLSYKGAIKSINTTLGSNFIASLKADWFYASVANFGSVLEQEFFEDDLNEGVFFNTIEQTNKNLNLIKRYFLARKKALNLSDFSPYDTSAPIYPDIKFEYDYLDSVEVIKQALSVLGDDYVKQIDNSVTERWADVYPYKNKRGGAYENAVYGFSPVMLLNHLSDNIGSVFTHAHEMGHAIHSVYTNNTQAYEHSGVIIFLAEIASTVNEIILSKYFYKNAKSKQEKVYFLDRYITLIRATIFQQVMYSEFEHFAHSLVQNGEAISKDVLNLKYDELIKKYYDGVEYNELDGYGWSAIPHFYSPYYVINYATGIISAICLANNILENNPDALNKYINFLKSGSNDLPLNILKNAGVDLLSADPFEIAFKELEAAVTEFEELI